MDDKRGISNLIKHCQKEELLPCVIFCFSKFKIMNMSDKISNYNLCNLNEKGKIT